MSEVDWHRLEWENLNWERLFSSLRDAQKLAHNSDIIGKEEELFVPRGSETMGDIVEKAFIGFGGEDLYPTIEEKVIAVVSSIEYNHSFTGGNKRAGFLVSEWLLTEADFIISEEIVYVLRSYIAAISTGNKTKEEREELASLGIKNLRTALNNQR